MYPTGYALAPKYLIEKQKPIMYMYCEEPDNQYDSGWRFFSGEETDEYVNDPRNIGIYSIETIVKLCPDVIPYLDCPVNTCLERDDINKPFRATD